MGSETCCLVEDLALIFDADGLHFVRLVMGCSGEIRRVALPFSVRPKEMLTFVPTG